MDTLSKILHQLKKNGMSDLEFAEKVGLYKTIVTEWKNGKTKSYNKHIPKIAEVLGVSTEYLLASDDTSSEVQKKIPPPSLQEAEEAYVRALIEAGYLKKGKKLTKEEMERLRRAARIALED